MWRVKLGSRRRPWRRSVAERLSTANDFVRRTIRRRRLTPDFSLGERRGFPSLSFIPHFINITILYKEGIAMRKLLLSFVAIMFLAVYVGHASAQEKPEEVYEQQTNIVYALMVGATKNHNVMFEPYWADATNEQITNFSEKMTEAIEPFNKELQEKVGDLGELSRDKLDKLAETLAALSPKFNAIVWKIMEETLPAEVVEKIEIRAFQQAGGIFGGALAIENLSVLRLDAQQKEKAVKIVEEVNREFFKLLYSPQFIIESVEEPEIAPVTVILKENVEKIISLLRDAQHEIESLLTDEQKQRAEELMADVPEEIRFLSNYLKNHP